MLLIPVTWGFNQLDEKTTRSAQLVGTHSTAQLSIEMPKNHQQDRTVQIPARIMLIYFSMGGTVLYIYICTYITLYGCV